MSPIAAASVTPIPRTIYIDRCRRLVAASTTVKEPRCGAGYEPDARTTHSNGLPPKHEHHSCNGGKGGCKRHQGFRSNVHRAPFIQLGSKLADNIPIRLGIQATLARISI
jgi:hypothetical protein